MPPLARRAHAPGPSFFPRVPRHVFSRGAASHTPQPARNPAQATGPRIAPPDGRWPHKEPPKQCSMGMDLPPAGAARGPRLRLDLVRDIGPERLLWVRSAGDQPTGGRGGLRVAPCARPIGPVFAGVARWGGRCRVRFPGMWVLFLSGGRLRRRWGSPGRGDPTSRRSCT